MLDFQTKSNKGVPADRAIWPDVRADFPFLQRLINAKPLIYFDNAATTQKPRFVIDELVRLYFNGIANVHRAVNFLSDEVTQAFEWGRETVARFIGAQAREIIFVSNATQAINYVCRALSQKRPLRVLTTTLEHHSNLLPWVEFGTVDFIPWTNEGRIDLDVLRRKLLEKPDLLAIAGASNFLGCLHPIREIVAACQSAGVPVLVDASQSIAHAPHDVRELQCDYMVFSGHKIYGPSGIGVLFVRHELIESMRPMLLGGGMVKEVHTRAYALNDIPFRFEAGTPNIEGVIGLTAALDYFSRLGYEAIAAHEAELIRYAKHQMAEVPALSLYGPPAGEECVPLVSFQINGLMSTAVAKILANRANVIVRSGFHCAQSAHEQLDIGPTVRASFALYNTKDEIDTMMEVLKTLTCFLE